jgi:DNA-binding transcriptional LysR family regulator
VIEQAHKLLAASGDLERSLRLYGAGEAGRVALGLGPLMAILLLPALGETLLRTRPGLQIATTVRTPDQLLPELLGDRIEMIVGNNWQMAGVTGIESRVLTALPLAHMVRAGHPLAGRKGLASADLADFPTASAVELAGAFGGGGAFVCDNYHILRDTVLRSDCVWLSSAAFVAPELEAGLMVKLDIEDTPAVETEICLLTRRGRTRSPAAIAVTEEIEAMLAALPR